MRSPFILNGVCVRWKGYLDMERLDGVGCIEFDEEMANVEDAILRETVEAYNRRIKEFEEHTKARSRQLAAFQQAAAAAHAQAAQAAAAAHAAAAASAAASSSSSAARQASSSSPPGRREGGWGCAAATQFTSTRSPSWPACSRTCVPT